MIRYNAHVKLKINGRHYDCIVKKMDQEAFQPDERMVHRITGYIDSMGRIVTDEHGDISRAAAPATERVIIGITGKALDGSICSICRSAQNVKIIKIETSKKISFLCDKCMVVLRLK
jgi:hypothetical protein